MQINKDEQEFIKANREIILSLLEKRFSDYVQALIRETDDDKSKVLKMWIQELQFTINTVNNICNLKDKKKKKKDEPDFTGI